MSSVVGGKIFLVFIRSQTHGKQALPLHKHGGSYVLPSRV